MPDNTIEDETLAAQAFANGDSAKVVRVTRGTYFDQTCWEVVVNGLHVADYRSAENALMVHSGIVRAMRNLIFSHANKS